MIDLYLYDKIVDYKDSYSYYDTDVDKILLYKKSDVKYVIWYNDVNRSNILPLQLKIKIIKLINVDKSPDFIKTASDGDEFIMLDVHKNTSFVEGNYISEIVVVLYSVIDNYLKTSLIQAKNKNYNNSISHSNIYNHCMYTQIIIKKNLLSFLKVFKNDESKEHEFWWQ